MADMSQLLNSLAMMQPNAQASLPVIPNNGNPMGANNMPNNNVQPAMPNSWNNALQHYPWLAPSPSMGTVQQMLQAPLINPQFTNTIHPIAPGNGGTMGPPTGPAGVPITRPVLPSQGYGAGPAGGYGYNSSGANVGQLQNTNPVLPVTTMDQDMYGARKVY